MTFPRGGFRSQTRPGNGRKACLLLNNVVMMGKACSPAAFSGCVAALFFIANPRACATDGGPVTQEQFRLLQQQNQALQQQLQHQQEVIEALTRKVGEMQDSSARRDQ